MGKALRNHSKVYKVPRRPWEKERIDNELKLVGVYGLRNKREVWRAHYTLAKIRSAARSLLTLDAKNSRRIFEGQAIIRRLHRLGVLPTENSSLDQVLSLTVEDFLKRRLQTVLNQRSNQARSIHHSRVLIRQKHIAVGDQMVNVPGFLVRLDAEKHIQIHPSSSLSPTGRPGRLKKKSQKSAPAAKGD